jgi:membrane protease YdiL (CAAX protease family)
MNLGIENLIMLASVGLLIGLRVDARRFGAADFDDEAVLGGWGAWLRRISWYGIGVLLVLAVYFLFPQPESVLHLRLGEPRGLALLAGIGLALLGGGGALAYAWWRFGGISLPAARAYPVGLTNAALTALVDEAAFRGILLGLLLFSNWPPLYAVAFQAAAYALTTRLGGTGRPRSLLLLWLGFGLLGGWLTVATGGIGGALLAHALTRFAIFAATGHAGQVTPSAVTGEEEREAAEVPDVSGLDIVPESDPGSFLRPIE